MGLDVYLRWDGITESEKKLQITGYDVTVGKFGYLRGAYNGHIGLDAIQQLFDGVDLEKEWKVSIYLLTENLNKLENGLFKKKKKEFYSNKGKDLEIQSYRDFVELAKVKSLAKKNPIVRCSG